MASPLGHTLAGLALLRLARGRQGGWGGAAATAAAAAAANLPDIDFLQGLLSAEPSLWHHRWTHSLGFAGLVSVCILAGAVVLKKPSTRGLRWAALGCSLVLLHLAIDLITVDDSPPVGLQVLWPFDDGYFIAPLKLFHKVERGAPNADLLRSWWRMGVRELLLGIPLAAAWIWRRDARKSG